MQFFFRKQECKAVYDVNTKIDPCPSRSWVQITTSSAKLTWLARHRNSAILSTHGDMFPLDGEIYIRNIKYLTLGALKRK